MLIRITCHQFVLDNAYSKNKNVILACLEEIFEEATIQKAEITFSDGPQTYFKNKYMIKGLYHLSEKFQVPFTWNYFTTAHGKGVVDEICREVKIIARQQVFQQN